MNQNNSGLENNSEVNPKTSKNMNVIIDNPSANINDTMNINIQQMPIENPQPIIQPVVEQNIGQENSISQNNANNNMNNNMGQIQNQNQTVIKENKLKKNTVTIKMGPEFKIALLIIIILLVFILLLPLVPNLFRG